MTLQQCRYLVALKEHQTMNRAAKALFTSQPSISKAIKEMEKELNILILNRSPQGVTFTNDGNELVQYATLMLAQMSHITNHFRTQENESPERYAISSQHYSFAALSLVNLLKSEVISERPYSITFHEGKASDVIENVANGNSILGILSLTEFNRRALAYQFNKFNIEFKVLRSEKQHVFIGNHHPLSKSSSLTYAQLKPYPYYTFKQDDLPLYFAEGVHAKSEAKQTVYLEDRATMGLLLTKSLGFNIGTGYFTNEMATEGLVAIPLEDGEPLAIGYIKKEHFELPEVIQKYLLYIQNALESST